MRVYPLAALRLDPSKRRPNLCVALAAVLPLATCLVVQCGTTTRKAGHGYAKPRCEPDHQYQRCFVRLPTSRGCRLTRRRGTIVPAPIEIEEGKDAELEDKERTRVPWDGLLLQPALDELQQVLTRCDNVMS